MLIFQPPPEHLSGNPGMIWHPLLRATGVLSVHLHLFSMAVKPYRDECVVFWRTSDTNFSCEVCHWVEKQSGRRNQAQHWL